MLANVRPIKNLDWYGAFTVTVAVFALALLIYSSTIVELVRTWLDSDEYGHGILLSLIAGYLVWQRKSWIAGTVPTGSWLGALLMAFAQLLHVAATLADMNTAKYYSLLLSLVAVPLAVGGIRFLRPFLFPFAVFFMAIPLPYLVNKLLTTEMQLISSDIGVWFIRAMGMPVFQDGNVIDMGSFVMLVEEACSGLRYLYPLLSISFMLAYFYIGRWWIKGLILVSAVPVTIFMNSLRIAITGWLIKHYGSEAAEGFLHDFEGWIIFVVALAIILAFIWLISLLVYKRKVFLTNFNFDSPEANQQSEASFHSSAPFYLMVAGLLAGGISSYALVVNGQYIIPDRQSFATFPMTVGERELYPDVLSESVLDVLKLDDYFIGDYVANDVQPINLYMAYYGAQTDGSAIHSPKDCLPGGGWEIVSLSVVSLEKAGLPGKANRAVIRKGEDALLVYFWVNQQGKNFASELAARASLLIRSVTENRTDGTLLRIISPLGEQSEARAEEEIQRFIADISTDLNRFLPE